MNKLTPNQARWVAELRSGKYRQTMNRLEDNQGMCCLGVAASIFIPETREPREGRCFAYDNHTGEAPPILQRILRLRGSTGEYDDGRSGSCLTSLNDDDQLSFAEIADFIEQNPTLVFVQPDEQDPIAWSDNP
jgi:hypothetical protein